VAPKVPAHGFAARVKGVARTPYDALRGAFRTARSAVVQRIVSAAARPMVASPGRCLVVAPHPDDETLACGGLMALKRASGAEVNVVLLSRGEGSHRGCCDVEPRHIGDVRQKLAQEAAGALGLAAANLHWAVASAGHIPRRGQEGLDGAVRGLAALIERLVPQEVFCPHPLDCWPDHEAATAMALEAIRTSGQTCELYFFLVWAWYKLPLRSLRRLGLSSARRLDIRPVVESKRAAIGAYLGAAVPGCGKPYVGVLPRGFLAPFRRSIEIYFARGPGGRGAEGGCP